jgi:hypothetical protein
MEFLPQQILLEACLDSHSFARHPLESWAFTWYCLKLKPCTTLKKKLKERQGRTTLKQQFKLFCMCTIIV